jgi:hypothetical protein
MKRIFLMSLSIFSAAIIFAQLKVTTNGKIGIGTFIPQEQLQIGDRWTFTNYTSKAINYNSYWNGATSRLQDGFSSSLRFNNDGSIQFDAGATGAANTPVSLVQTMRINNNGNVAIGNISPEYKLDVVGIVRSPYFLKSSDRKLKSNIEPIETPLEKVLKLNGVSYNLNIKIDVNNRKHFGFIAQDLKEVIPEIVFEDSKGTLSVDYMAIIPYLVEAIKLQNKEISELKLRLKLANPENQSLNTNSEVINSCKLYQNNPNPFDNSTQIKSIINENIKNAYLYIYDMNGMQKQKITITQRGITTTDISANSLKAGMYFYSLICDGQEVDTKKMIITE